MPYILGVKVDNLTHSEALAHIDQMIRAGGQHIVTTPNPEFIVAAQKDLEFRGILNKASLALPDGVGLMWAACALGTPLKERIAGSDFVWDIAQLAAREGYSIYLLGAGQGIAESAARELGIRNKELRIVGVESGPIFSSSRAQRSGVERSHTDVCNRVRNAQPDILFVAFGHPRQEKWIAAHLAELPSVKIAMGVGGALDFIAGRVRRAPRLMRVLGLEWLWRLILQPWRIVRIYRAVILFPLLLFREYLTKR